jgi:hypothetical protein
MSATPQTMLKVVATGLQDLSRLNAPVGQPRTDPYRYVLRRRTRWASQWRFVPCDGLADFGRTVTCTLPQDGELITRAVLVVQMPDLFTPQGSAVFPNWVWTNSLGHALCESISFSLSNIVLDTVDSRLMEVLDDTDGAIEHLTTKNQMIARDPSYFPMANAGGVPCPPLNAIGQYPDYQSKAMTLHIAPPFWWNKGPGPSALPLQALYQESVQLTVTFRTIDQLVLPLYPHGTTTDLTSTMTGSVLYDGSGRAVGTMPAASQWHIQNAYWLVEYISLEEREAAAFRLTDLQIPFLQHAAAPVIGTNGSQRLRMGLEQGGLIRDMIWVAQNSRAEVCRAWFNFGRDLSGNSPSDLAAAITKWSPIIAVNNPTLYTHLQPYLSAMTAAAATTAIWWPNAFIPDWNYSDGYYVPSSVDRYADPFDTTSLTYRSNIRFELTSFTRTLMPALSCRRTAIVNRYIHRHDFGFWPSGGLAETLQLTDDQIRGVANWDKLQNKELQFVFRQHQGVPVPLFLYIWFTRVNMIRIFAGRAAVMFDV